MRLRAVAMVLLWLPAISSQGPPSGQPRSAKTWVGRYHEIEEYLRNADCESMKWFAPNYAARCTLRPGGPIAAMAWRPIPDVRREVVPGGAGIIRQGFRENYMTEIAAYELDKLLELDMVPPTVERQMQGIKGSAQQWVEDVVDATDPAVPEGKDRVHWESEQLRMVMFDMLIGNRERNRRNMLRDKAWNLILIDHSRAFGTGLKRVGKLTAVDRAVWARIDGLTRGQLEQALQAWLDQDEIDAILERRDMMRADVKSLLK
jgi:hypothetical protein